jgi:nicotinamide riboside kinase
VTAPGEDALLRVVLIGPESTGKTRLASELAARYGVPWSPEYAREFVTGRKEALGLEDVDAIGRGRIEKEARARVGDLYLLHHVDVAWVGDGLQREQPARREELFELFQTTLDGLGAAVHDVRGSWDERHRHAIQTVDRLLA